jgi:hypothetical protein
MPHFGTKSIDRAVPDDGIAQSTKKHIGFVAAG